MDKNKNLEEFFRNRINDLDSGGDDWDKPDGVVFRKAQEQFPTYPPKHVWNWKAISMVLAAALILGLTATVFYLHKKSNNLEQELHIAKTNIQNSNQQLNELQKSQAESTKQLKAKQQETIKELQADLIAFANTNTNTNTTTSNFANQPVQTNTPSTTFVKPEPNTNKHKNANKSVHDSNSIEKAIGSNQSINTKTTLANKPRSFDQESTGKYKTTLLYPLPFKAFENEHARDLKSEITYPIASLIKPKRKGKKFEVGLHLNVLNFNSPTDYDFKKQESVENKSVNFSSQTIAPNMHIAYAIRPNLWIRAGFRKANITSSQYASSAFYYNKDEEYTDDQGKTFNTLSINPESNGSDVPAKQLDFEVPSTTAIEDKDVFFAKWKHSREFSLTQIPFGLTYFRGKNNLQWLINGGMAWNKLSGYEHIEDTDLFFKDESLPLKETDFKGKKTDLNDSYMSAYAGIGLNYQLTKNWHLRSSFNLERNFNNNSSNNQGLTKAFRLGLGFRW